MANMHLVTGFAGYEHITSADQGLFNSYIFGDLEVVMERGNQFAASIISNNIIRVKDGDLLMQGRFARLNDDSYVDLTIDNGTQGYFRNDLIVARYQKDIVTAVETVDLVVIKGENFESDPVDPDHVKGDIKFGKDFQNDIPLWRVSLDGLNVTGLTCLFSTFGMTMSKHADQHSADGSDPITLASIGAASHSALMSHVENTGNPHQVTATQIPVSEKVLTAHKQEGEWSVDDILTRIGNLFNSGQIIYQWKKEKTDFLSTYPHTMTTLATNKVYHSEEISIDDDGKITLVNPTSFAPGDVGSSKSAIPVGRYFYAGGYKTLSYVYRATAETTFAFTSTGNINDGTFKSYGNYYNAEMWQMLTLAEVVTSTDPNAYTDGYVDADGYTYTELEPIASFVPLMSAGTYTGTGTYGANNPCILSFDFVPKLVWIRSIDKGNMAVFFASTLSEAFAASGYVYATNTGNMASAAGYYASVNGNNLNWYGSNATTQMNVSGNTYSIGAIG